MLFASDFTSLFSEVKLVLAFDTFKSCITAYEACHAAAEALRHTYTGAEVIAIPVSDGGEGLVQSLATQIPTNKVAVRVHNPLMKLISAEYAISLDGNTAYMEMAAASGLTLITAAERNPLRTTTYGVGEMIYDAVRRGCKSIVMGIGGSATCDAGAGMVQFLQPYLPLGVEILVASDVRNPLYGEDGAAFVFGPQKGATPNDLPLLDERLRAFARKTEALGMATEATAFLPGAGAAGGLGYAMMAYLGQV